MAVTIICGLIFLFFPTAYPRPDIAYSQDSILDLAQRLAYAWDTPRNCLPSAHVAAALVCAYFLGQTPRFAQGPWRIFIYMWVLLIIISTLTTKQHYVVDILAGMLLFLFTIGIQKSTPLLQRRTKPLKNL